MQVHVEPCRFSGLPSSEHREKEGGRREGRLFRYDQKTSWTGTLTSRRKRRYSNSLGNSNPRSHEMIFSYTFRQTARWVSLTSRAVRSEAAKQLPDLEIESVVQDAHSLGSISIRPVGCELGVALRLSSLSIRLGWTCGMPRGGPCVSTQLTITESIILPPTSTRRFFVLRERENGEEKGFDAGRDNNGQVKGESEREGHNRVLVLSKF